MTTEHPGATVTLIAAVARNGVIGSGGDIPWRIPEDWRRFKQLTMGHVLVMGRRTYDSIGRPLPGRTTVVVTRQPGWVADGIHVTTSVADAMELAASIDDTVYVLGGSQIYTQTLGLADRLELTEVHAEPAGDTFFPDVDWSEWDEVSREPHDGFDFVTYTRSARRPVRA
ncbi:dihydrofolate reductase [Phytoactinopolyspora limicola]|uniref:dihydrofolate reductase n=1 Tax=Phytoactinopolyspora limicola TaxID=2715536 RepID=UPI00140A1911|nr:dihydrofolate reductase [Phytoactinopolyspora limicola]